MTFDSRISGFCWPMLLTGVLVHAAGCGHGSGGSAEPVDLDQAVLEWSGKGRQWSDEELLVLEGGKRLYRERCAGCHQRAGTGSAVIGAPALKGSAVAKGDPDILIETVLFGRATMPAFRMSVDDEELARILSYVRNAWGNGSQDLVPASRVAALRAGKELEVPD